MMQSMANVATGFASSQSSIKATRTSDCGDTSQTSAMNISNRLLNHPILSYVSTVKICRMKNRKTSLIQGRRVICFRPVRQPDERRTRSSCDGRKTILDSATLRSLPGVKDHCKGTSDLERAALERAFGENRWEISGVLENSSLELRFSSESQSESQDMEGSNPILSVIRRNSLGGRKNVQRIPSPRLFVRRRNAKKRAMEAEALSTFSAPQTSVCILQNDSAVDISQNPNAAKLQNQRSGRTRLESSGTSDSQDRNKASTSIVQKDKSDVHGTGSYSEFLKPKQNGGIPSVLIDWSKVHHRILTAEEEAQLSERVKYYKQLHTLRQELSNKLKREPSAEEWAKEANLSLGVFLDRIQAATSARNKLVHYNLRLVLSHALKYAKGNLPLTLNDLCQAGVKGLIDAINHFDPQQGLRFSKYALFWVRTAIVRAVSKFGHISQEPYNFAMAKLKIKNARIDLHFDLQRPPTDEEIREHLGFKAEKYRRILRTTTRVTSLNVPENRSDGEKISNLADPTSEKYVIKYVGEMLAHVLDCLNPEEKLVLIERYGLRGGREQSLREVGVKLNLSQEMVRRYETRGLVRLRHSSHKKYLRQCLEEAKIWV